MATKAKADDQAGAKSSESAGGARKKVIHVRLDGKTKTLPFADLSVTARSTDDEIIAVLAKQLRVDIERFALLNVERTKDGNIFIRPDSIFSEK